MKRRVLVAAGGVLLSVSLGANLLIGRAARGYLEAVSDVRLDPAGLKIYEKDRAQRPSGGRVLVFFGDSRAVMWSAPSLPGYTLVNRGAGNQTTAQILLRFDSDVAPLRPAVVVLEAGVNDLKAIAEFSDRRGEIVADCKANITRIVENCRHVGARVVLVTVFDIGAVPPWRRPFWSGEVAQAVREVNAFLPTLAGDGVVLLDAAAALERRDGEIERVYQLDHLHLTPAGYAALNRQLVPLVSALPR